MDEYLRIRIGDYGPEADIVFTLYNEDGSLFDFTDCNDIYFLVWNPALQYQLMLSGECVAATPLTSGVCTYQRAQGDFTVKGEYKGAIQVTYSDGQVTSLTFPVFVDYVPKGS